MTEEGTQKVSGGNEKVPTRTRRNNYRGRRELEVKEKQRNEMHKTDREERKEKRTT